MDARVLAVAAVFGLLCGLMVPREGDDRRVVIRILFLSIAIGIGAWLFTDDPYAGPSLTVGGISTLIGTQVGRPHLFSST